MSAVSPSSDDGQKPDGVRALNIPIEVRDSPARRALRKRNVHQPPQYFADNAYGLVLSEQEDGERIPVICGHGGSSWLCHGCAVTMLRAENPVQRET